MPLLTKEALQAQKKIFENVLVQELLYEVKFIQDQMAERADIRLDFKEKVIVTITTVLSKALAIGSLGTAVVAPPVSVGAGIAAELLDVAGDKLTQLVQSRQQKSLFTLGDLFFAEDKNKLEVCFCQLAKAASLRYEYLIGVLLSEKPNEGVISLARTGARRIIEYLCRLAEKVAEQAKRDNEFKHLPLDIDTLLDGLIQGRSGKWIDGFKNTPLVAREASIKDLTAEGAYSRSAMRLLPQGQLSKKNIPIYHRSTALQQQEGVDSSYDWGRVKYRGDDESKGPKYGYMLVDEATLKAYGYSTLGGGQQFPDDVTKDFNDYPTVKVASRDDILEYCEQIHQKRVAQQEEPSFLEFIQQKYQKANYLNSRIDEVWVRADLSDEHLTGNYDEVDFSSCDFRQSTFELASFVKAKFNFVTAQGLNCKQVIFDQADWNYADLDKASFVGPVSYVGAKWLGANVKGLQMTDGIAAIEQEQARQANAAESSRAQLFEIQKKLESLEEELNRKYQIITANLQTTDDTLQQHTERLKQLAEVICQGQFNFKAYQLYLEDELDLLQRSLTQMSEQQASIKQQREEAISQLRQQVKQLQSAEDKYEKLLEGLQLQIQHMDLLNEQAIQTLHGQFTSQHEALRTELYQHMTGLEERVGAIEQKIEGDTGKSSRTFTQRVATARKPGTNAIRALDSGDYTPARTKEMLSYMKEAQPGDAVHMDGAIADSEDANAYVLSPNPTQAQLSFVQALQTSSYVPPIAGSQSTSAASTEPAQFQQRPRGQLSQAGKIPQKK